MHGHRESTFAQVKLSFRNNMLFLEWIDDLVSQLLILNIITYQYSDRIPSFLRGNYV